MGSPSSRATSAASRPAGAQRPPAPEPPRDPADLGRRLVPVERPAPQSRWALVLASVLLLSWLLVLGWLAWRGS